jgi:hypothetical protein
MDISEVEGMNMIDEQDHLMNHRWGEEDIQMVEMEGMDTVDEHYHPMNHRPKVEGMDMDDSGMGEDMTVELKVVEREPEGVVLARHWTGMERRGIGKLVGSGRSLRNRGVQKVNPCLQVKTLIVVHHVIECRRVKKIV